MLIATAHLFIQSDIECRRLLYIGPGMDGGLISLIVAFLISLFTYLMAIIWYPVKKTIHFFKRLTGKTSPKNPEGDSGSENNSKADGKG